METETYLGDGLYASYDGFQVRLRAPRLDGDHEVYLEPQLIANFLNFLKEIGVKNVGLA